MHKAADTQEPHPVLRWATALPHWLHAFSSQKWTELGQTEHALWWLSLGSCTCDPVTRLVLWPAALSEHEWPTSDFSHVKPPAEPGQDISPKCPIVAAMGCVQPAALSLLPLSPLPLSLLSVLPLRQGPGNLEEQRVLTVASLYPWPLTCPLQRHHLSGLTFAEESGPYTSCRQPAQQPHAEGAAAEAAAAGAGKTGECTALEL